MYLCVMELWSLSYELSIVYYYLNTISIEIVGRREWDGIEICVIMIIIIII